MRKITFQNEYYYHVYNRGVDKREVFSDEQDYLRFLKSLGEFNRPDAIESLYRQDQIKRKNEEALGALRLRGNRSAPSATKRLVEIICYCLNPNHFHLLLKQLDESGISKFMQKLGQGYTRYFNDRNGRSGALFQGKFKARQIKSEEQLLYVSSYINGNPEIHGFAKAEEWAYSSYRDFLGKRPGMMNNKMIILKKFDRVGDYRKFTNEAIKNSSAIKDELKKMRIE